ncbi:hypothetical protein [Thalassovita mangrovi]|uniref:Uncharacterized protein n=1 Tax=Thalassovita mangrovi TaxID=2692236 RepID=A0A6L8LM84_9RHOB|nr:hypothetical protein [Thalassovita mangrovi]MYM54782.1 hypothetical protein [Thalassovita mangrovi]
MVIALSNRLRFVFAGRATGHQACRGIKRKAPPRRPPASPRCDREGQKAINPLAPECTRINRLAQKNTRVIANRVTLHCNPDAFLFCFEDET